MYIIILYTNILYIFFSTAMRMGATAWFHYSATTAPRCPPRPATREASPHRPRFSEARSIPGARWIAQRSFPPF